MSYVEILIVKVRVLCVICILTIVAIMCSQLPPNPRPGKKAPSQRSRLRRLLNPHDYSANTDTAAVDDGLGNNHQGGGASSFHFVRKCSSFRISKVKSSRSSSVRSNTNLPAVDVAKGYVAADEGAIVGLH
nr:hypothetical protein HmN_000946900 [Hymenolepis microstoma]